MNVKIVANNNGKTNSPTKPAGAPCSSVENTVALTGNPTKLSRKIKKPNTMPLDNPANNDSLTNEVNAMRVISNGLINAVSKDESLNISVLKPIMQSKTVKLLFPESSWKR